jgi:hypothetical protein
MARPKSRFVCQSCAESFLRWEGQCPACGEWNSLVETVVHEAARGVRVATRPGVGPGAVPAGLAAIADADLPRLRLGIDEFDRVLGGGLVPGSLVLVGGEPGIGKSTLLLQAAAGLTHAPGGGSVLYASGEESPGQVRLRAARLGLLDGPSANGVRVLAEHDVGRIVDTARSERPVVVIVDSIQTATIDELDGAAGSVGQVRESTLRLMDLAKGDGIADDTEVIQKALDSLKNGGVVNLAAGSYKLSAALKVPGHVTLMGEGARWENTATRLIVPVNGFSAVRLSHGSGVKALCISYPNNQDNEKPEAYPPSILLEGINPSVESIVFDSRFIS